METPWGRSQKAKIIGNGIVFHHTASHGGIHLSPQRVAEMKEKFPEFQTFTKSEVWYEEDSDQCVVILAWPELYPDEVVRKIFHFVSKVNYFQKCRQGKHWESLVKKYGMVKTPA